MFEIEERKCLICKRRLYRFLFDSDSPAWKERFCCEEHRDIYLCPPSYPFIQTTASSCDTGTLTMETLREAIDLLESASHVNCRCVLLGKKGQTRMSKTVQEAFENLERATANFKKVLFNEMRRIIILIFDKLFPGYGIKWKKEYEIKEP